MLFRRDNSGILRPHHLSRGRRHGRGQGGGGACLASAAHGPSGPWVPWPHRLLQEVHSWVRRHHGAANIAAQAGVFPVVTGGRGDLRCPKERSHIGAGVAATRLQQAVHHRLQRIQLRLRLQRSDTSRLRTAGILQPHHAKLAVYKRELIGLVKAVRHW
jgi:hypothetical protein